MNSQNPISGIGSYEQLMQHYPSQQQQQQQQRNQSQFRLQSYGDQGVVVNKSLQTPDRFGLLGLLSVIRMSDPDLTSLALGIDLTTLGLNLNSAENLHRTFGSPWSDEPVKGDPDFMVPQCYYAKQAPVLNVSFSFSFFLLFNMLGFY